MFMSVSMCVCYSDQDRQRGTDSVPADVTWLGVGVASDKCASCVQE